MAWLRSETTMSWSPVPRRASAATYSRLAPGVEWVGPKADDLDPRAVVRAGHGGHGRPERSPPPGRSPTGPGRSPRGRGVVRDPRRGPPRRRPASADPSEATRTTGPWPAGTVRSRRRRSRGAGGARSGHGGPYGRTMTLPASGSRSSRAKRSGRCSSADGLGDHGDGVELVALECVEGVGEVVPLVVDRESDVELLGEAPEREDGVVLAGRSRPRRPGPRPPPSPSPARSARGGPTALDHDGRAAAGGFEDPGRHRFLPRVEGGRGPQRATPGRAAAPTARSRRRRRRPWPSPTPPRRGRWARTEHGHPVERGHVAAPKGVTHDGQWFHQGLLVGSERRR